MLIGKDYDVVIITAYNNRNDITDMIHTVCITQMENGEYVIHNDYRINAASGKWEEYRTGMFTLADAISKIGRDSAAISVIGINRQHYCALKKSSFVMADCYCSDVHKSSGNHAPKCLPFGILCAKMLLFTPTIPKMVPKSHMGVNSNGGFGIGMSQIFFNLVNLTCFPYNKY